MPPKDEKNGKSKTCTFRCLSRIFHFHRIYWGRMAKPFLTQASVSWEPVTPPTDGRPPPAHHADMEKSFPNQPPRLVEEVLGTGQLPCKFYWDISARLQVTDKKGGTISLELRFG